jgi:1,4-alpha-glucan branching enzyme
MNPLSPDAYAILEGRHSDPFHYLGPHVEDDAPVVRVYLPDAENVTVINEHGEECELCRVHEAGLFVGELRNGSSPCSVWRSLR